MNLQKTFYRLGWLRLVVFLLLSVLLGWLRYDDFALPNATYWVTAGYIPLTALAFWQGKRRTRESHLLIHILAESLLIAMLLYFSGGATNPAISYLLVLLVFAAYSLATHYAAIVAGLMIVIYSALMRWYEPLAHAHHHGSSLFDWHVAGMWLTFVISAAIIASILPALMQDRQRRLREIQSLREQQLKNEQLIGIATLAAGTAHEMGTPLMTMNMLLDDATNEDGTLSETDVSLMRQQVDRCRHSLQQLAMAGRHANKHGYHDAGDWLERQLHRWRLSKPHALWDELVLKDSVPVPASPLLDQALLNLLDNAAEAGQQAIQLEARVNGRNWELDIRQPDPNAAGYIADESIFASEKEHGLGIGLYLSNASIEQFGGSIHLQEMANGGSLSRLSLPCQKEGA